MKQINLFEFEKKVNSVVEIVKDLPFKRVRDEYFDFKDFPASSRIYGIHPYPAMFHFLVVRKLISDFSNEGAQILDPFMGSGVVAGECLISKRNFIGYDINPLAVLIAKVRTTPIETKLLLKKLEYIGEIYKGKKPYNVNFHNIDYWFDKDVIKMLSKLRQAIYAIEDDKMKAFFKVAFSETVRRVSRTRYNEFKLLRRKDIENNLNVLKTFRDISLKNIGLLSSFYEDFIPSENTLKLENINITDGIPLDDNSIDLVVTSPPYGDSRTTVAYGQFSRLSLRWLGLEENVDRTSLGSKAKNISYDLPSNLLYEFVERIANKDEKRAKEVFSFYKDLYNSIQIIASKVKNHGFVCFVVGNRRVKGLELPTDKISADLFECNGFQHQRTFVRSILHKRMPSENSPSNIRGEKDSTMRYEYIVILKKN
ncbi:MAG: DNA methyltransferase [bacterium]